MLEKFEFQFYCTIRHVSLLFFAQFICLTLNRDKIKRGKNKYKTLIQTCVKAQNVFMAFIVTIITEDFRFLANVIRFQCWT